MSDARLTKDQVSLDDLKLAIARVERYKNVPLMEQLSNAVALTAAERDAWRTAFEWLNRVCDDDMQTVEHVEGFQLIREKLR